MLFQNSIGIDIRDDRISIVHLKTSLKGIQLAGHYTQSLETGASVSKRLKDASQMVADFMHRGKIRVAEIFIGVPGKLVLQRIVELPAAVAENLIQTLNYELEKYVPIPADEIYLDAQIISEDKKTGRLSVLLLVARKEALDPYISFGQGVGQGAGGIETEATGLSNYLTFQSNIADTQPFVYFLRDEKSFNIGLLQNGKLHFSRNVPIAETEADTLSSVKTEIRSLVAHFGLDNGPLHVGMEGDDLSSISAESLTSVAGSQASLSPLPTGSLPVRQFAAAYGLALKGITKTPMQINFMPPGLRKKPSKIGYHTMTAMVAAILMLGIFWGGSSIFQQRILAKRIDDRLASLKNEVTKVTELETEIDTLEKQIDRLVSLRQAYVPVIGILKELTDTIPEDAWLQEIALSGKNVQISGLAKSASTLVTNLEESPLFCEVAFLSAITKEKDGKEKFRIGLKTE